MVPTGLVGERIRWARTQQELTLRWIEAHGGPSVGYQSEVEQGHKGEVRSATLSTWVNLLHVTESFVRGEFPRYREDPAPCRGLAADAGALAIREGELLALLSPQERVRHVLQLIADHSRQVPRVVLAYVLGINLYSLNGMIAGALPISDEVVDAVSSLTGLSERFLRLGEQEPGVAAELRTAIVQAYENGATTAELVQVVRSVKKGVLVPDSSRA